MASTPARDGERRDDAVTTSGRAGGPHGGREVVLQQVIDHLVASPTPLTVRSVAAAVGVSHRTLLHHFGSKAGLLAAVADALSAEHRRSLMVLRDPSLDALHRLTAAWAGLVSFAGRRAPLHFELASRLMAERSGAGRLDVEAWVDALAPLWSQLGVPSAAAAVHARLDLAVIRGLLHDLALTRDAAAVERSMAWFVELSRRSLTRESRLP